IAIRNARLFEAVQARSAELREALTQQTATADVLKVISRSAFELPKVLEALVVSAARLCHSHRGFILIRDGDTLFPGATLGADTAEAREVMKIPLAIDRRTVSGRVALSGRVEHIEDVLADPEYDYPLGVADTRAMMGVPLLKEGRVEGVFVLER